MQRLLLFVIILHITDVNTLKLKNYKVGECSFKGEHKPHNSTPCDESLSSSSDGSSSSKKLRNSVKNADRLWDNGEVPYVLTGSFTDNQKTILKLVMDLFNHYTCIKFVPKTNNHKFYAEINNNENICCSNVGKVRSRGYSIVTLGEICFDQNVVGTIIHEFMHLVGFYHEHSRSDRDDHIELLWSFIDPRKFDSLAIQKGNTHNLPYDYDSVMHYDVFGGSIGFPAASFSPKNLAVLSRLGQICGFSKLDITKINIVYNCPQKTAQLNLQNDLLYGVDISTPGKSINVQTTVGQYVNVNVLTIIAKALTARTTVGKSTSAPTTVGKSIKLPTNILY